MVEKFFNITETRSRAKQNVLLKSWLQDDLLEISSHEDCRLRSGSEQTEVNLSKWSANVYCVDVAYVVLRVQAEIIAVKSVNAMSKRKKVRRRIVNIQATVCLLTNFHNVLCSASK